MSAIWWQGAPHVDFLLELWTILQQLEAIHRDSTWSDVENWRLIPLRNNLLIRIGDRDTVFCPPPGTTAATAVAQEGSSGNAQQQVEYEQPGSDAAHLAPPVYEQPAAPQDTAAVAAAAQAGPSSPAVRVSGSGSASADQQQQQPQQSADRSEDAGDGAVWCRRVGARICYPHSSYLPQQHGDGGVCIR